MQQAEEECGQGIGKILAAVKGLISKMFQSQHLIPFLSKQTCVLMTTLIKHTLLDLEPIDGVKEEIEACMGKLATLAGLHEMEKFGERFPLFSYVIKKYQYQFQTKINSKAKPPSTLPDSPRPLACQPSPCTQAISNKDLSFLQSPQSQANKFFTELLQNELILQNPQCICCARVFIQGGAIFNANPYISVVVDLGAKWEKIGLERAANAVCNFGGGVVVIGAERKEGHLCAVGVKYDSVEQIAQRHQQIELALQTIRPACHYSIQQISVHTNPSSLNPDPSTVANEFLRLCFRITIRPQRIDMLHYLQFSAKGYQNVYEIYVLGADGVPLKVELGRAYDIVRGMYGKQRRVNSHEGVFCYRPYPYYSKIFNDHINQGLITEKQLLEHKPVQQEQEQESKPQDDPIFAYQHSSLLVVPSKKYDRYIQDFIRALYSSKQALQLSKPFSDSFANPSRSIWMLSHKKTTQQIKELLTSFETLGILQPETINIIPVHRMLQVERSKFSEHSERLLQQKFKKRYTNELYRTEPAYVLEKGKQKNILYLMFNDFGQAIYAYFLFDEMQIRPIFVRESSINKGKVKGLGAAY